MSETAEPELAAQPRRRRRLWPRSRRGKVILVAVLVVAIAGGGVGAWFLTRPAQGSEATRQVLTVSTTTLKDTVSASGTLEPQRQADLTFSSSGKVTAINVAVGDSVTQGQSLATSDTSELDIAVESAKADLVAAQGSLEDLEDSDDASDAAINAAEASVQVKKNAVTQAEANLAAATITAPFDGIVAEVNVAVGDSAGGSSSSTSSSSSGGAAPSSTGQSSTSTSSTSSAAIVLISKDAYSVTTSVSSSDVASVKRGLQAELTVSGSDEVIYGTVSSVAVVATTSTSGTASFPVTIDVTGNPTGLFAGSSVTAQIIVSQQSNVIAISPAAITTVDGVSTVTKVVDGVDTSTQITTGETIDGSTIVTQGLAEGDQIVVEFTPITGTQQDGQQGGQDVQVIPDGAAPDMSGGQAPGGGFPGGGQGQQPGGTNR